MGEQILSVLKKHFSTVEKDIFIIHTMKRKVTRKSSLFSLNLISFRMTRNCRMEGNYCSFIMAKYGLKIKVFLLQVGRHYVGVVRFTFYPWFCYLSSQWECLSFIAGMYSGGSLEDDFSYFFNEMNHFVSHIKVSIYLVFIYQ